MTSYLRVFVTVPHDTGLPEDAMVNTMAIRVDDPATRETGASSFSVSLTAFYDDIKAILSSQYDWDNGTIEYVDLADNRPRIPFQTDVLNIGVVPTIGADWPAEISICVSLSGTPTSGVNMKRRRGRFYVGPLQQGDVDNPLMSSGTADLVATAAEGLLTAGSAHLCVYSRYHHHGVPVGENIASYPEEIVGNIETSFTEVTKIWVDNAWDTQRRRGPKATYRKTILA